MKYATGILTMIFFLNTQASNNVEWLRGNGKFNVVAAVLGIIFLGMIIWLFFQDRKLSKLEKEIKNNKHAN